MRIISTQCTHLYLIRQRWEQPLIRSHLLGSLYSCTTCTCKNHLAARTRWLRNRKYWPVDWPSWYPSCQNNLWDCNWTWICIPSPCQYQAKLLKNSFQKKWKKNINFESNWMQHEYVRVHSCNYKLIQTANRYIFASVNPTYSTSTVNCIRNDSAFGHSCNFQLHFAAECWVVSGDFDVLMRTQIPLNIHILHMHNICLEPIEPSDGVGSAAEPIHKQSIILFIFCTWAHDESIFRFLFLFTNTLAPLHFDCEIN